MSGLPEAEFIISLNTSELVQGSQTAKKVFQEMSQSGLSAMSTVQVQADKTVTSLDKTNISTKSMGGSFSDLAARSIALTTSFSSLYFEVDRLEKSNYRLELANRAVENAQEKVNKLHQQGKDNTQEYANALRDLGLAQEKQSIMAEQMNHVQTEMALSLTTFAAVTLPTAIKGIKELSTTVGISIETLRGMAPELLLIAGAVTAWEFGISKIIQQHTGLDVSIEGNIQKLIQQNQAINTTTESLNDYSITSGPAVLSTKSFGSSVADASGQIDSMGTSLDTVNSKIKTFQDEITASLQSFDTMKSLQNGQSLGQIPGMPNTGLTMSLSPTSDLFGAENDLLEKIKSISGSVADQRLEFDALGDSIKKVGTRVQIAYGDEGLQQFLNKINEIGHGGKDQIEELAKSFSKLDGTIKTTSTSLDSMKKKADDQLSIIISDLAKTTGIPEELMAMSFSPGGAGPAFNKGLQDQWDLGNRVFGSAWEALNQGLSRGLPFIESVGNSVSNSGINTSSPVGGLHNNDEWNRLVSLVANQHMFGPGLFTVVKDDNRLAVENGEANAQARFEASSPQWQKFKALKFAGLFNGDPNLSIEQNLENAENQYDAIFSPMRSDVAAKLKAAHVSTTGYYTGDNRTGMSYVTDYSYTLPSQDEIKRAIADSLFVSEQAFQSKVTEAQTKLGLSVNDIINSLSNTLTTNDIQAELEFQSRLAAMSSGA